MNSLSLYLHFPFCKAKCSYCDFYSVSQPDRMRDYEKALENAVCRFGQKYPDRKVITVYFGGGTPSLMSPEGIERVLLAVRRSFSVDENAEITMEMNPESAKDSVLLAAKRSGVNRLSFGAQSASDDELCALGRLHRFQDVRDGVEKAREIGFSNLSLDLMYGLPEQTLSSWQESLEKTVSLEPTHLSFYCLTLSPAAPLYLKRNLLPDDELSRKMYLFAHSFLEEKGFEHYEISNAAKKGFRSRHNEVYWQGGEYLGIGPSAHSLMNNTRFFMEDGVDEFISASNIEDRIKWEEPRKREDLRTEYLMLSLRRKEGVSLEKLRFLSDEAFCREAEKKLLSWEKFGLCRKTEDGFSLTPKGFFVSNEIISELI